MIRASDAIAELHRRFAQNPRDAQPDADDIARWMEGSIAAEAELYDDLASELARGYADGRYAFAFCDAVVNGLFGVLVENQMREAQRPWPRLFQRVYEAFDAGEFHRREDKSDDPVADHTDPMIAAIVSQL